MAEVKTMRLSKVLREFNISLDRAVEHLAASGYEVEPRPTTKISDAEYQVLFDEFQTDKSKKVASKEVGDEKRKEKEELRLAREKEQEEKQSVSRVIKAESKLEGPKKVGKIDLEGGKPAKEKVKEEAPKVEAPVTVVAETPAVEEKPKKKKVVKAKAKAEAPVKEEAKEEVKETAKTEEKASEELKKETPEAVVEEKTEAVEEEVKESKLGSDKVKTQYCSLSSPNKRRPPRHMTQRSTAHPRRRPARISHTTWQPYPLPSCSPMPPLLCTPPVS